MQRKLTLLGLLCFLTAGNILFAQSSASSTSIDNSLSTINEETFFEDTDNHVIYIDFENVKVILSDIKVKDNKGEIVLKDELWSLPVNTIYELDYSSFTPGDYEIELRSFTGVMKKTVSVR